VFPLLCAALVALPALAARRVALVVGANQAIEGRAPLRFSHDDARELQDVLVRAGDFREQDVHALFDPQPAEVTALLDRLLAEAAQARDETLLLFYYSGHADERALYPAGRPLSLADLRERLSDRRAAVRVGIVDACRGGAWTRAKGLKAEAPFEVTAPLALASEGSVLMASSSGDESAHEADSLRGSYFTHHLVAGLRGAADTTGTGQVTLGQAFAYAQRYTIRDTSRIAAEPQHPSFDMQLRGRTDLALTRAEASPTLVSVQQTRGPLQLVQLSTGVVLLEAPAGERRLKLAVPPGSYLVRRRDDSGYSSREILVESGRPLDVDEASLTLVGAPQLASKGRRLFGLPAGARSTQPAGYFSFGIGVGYGHNEHPIADGFTPGPNADRQIVAYLSPPVWSLTDRLQITPFTPGFSYRFGQQGGTEIIPSIYSNLVYHQFGDLLGYSLRADVAVRKWLSETRNLTVRAWATSTGLFQAYPSPPSDEPQHHGPDRWVGGFALGYSQTFAEVLTLNLAVRASNAFVMGAWQGYARSDLGLELGSVMSVGSRALPLVQWAAGETWSLDFYASTGVVPRTGDLHNTVLLGVTKLF
jgi:hypothetical protein